MGWVAGGLALAIIAGLLWHWQVNIAEGVYLGQKTVTLLYDQVADRYNNIKDFQSLEDPLWLGEPLSGQLGRDFKGVVLDVATGTGRLPVALAQLPYFKGRVIGVDHSAGMLAVARQTMPSLPLVRADAMRLPFAAGSVGAVTCLEALEFFPSPSDALAEMSRVMRGGAILLTTRRIGWETRLMPGQTWTETQLKTILQQRSFEHEVIIPWLDIYQQVWARKKEAV